METVTIEIGGLCNMGVRQARSALRVIPGVNSAEVSFPQAVAKVEYESHKVDLDQFRRAMSAMGFEAQKLAVQCQPPLTRVDGAHGAAQASGAEALAPVPAGSGENK